MREGVLTSNPLALRRCARSGRNRVFVNDQPTTTLRLLSDLAPYLLRIHGQRDEMGLIVRCRANVRKGVRLPWERRRLAGT